MSEPASITFESELDERGRFHPIGARGVRMRLGRWGRRRSPGNLCLVTVERYVKLKTNPQLRYFHGPVVKAWSDHTGYSLEETKRELKRAYLERVPVVCKITGEEDVELPSLRDVSEEVMSAFITRCRDEAALRGVYIPSPDEWEAGQTDSLRDSL